MATRAQIATNVRRNLHDAGVTFFDAEAINDAIQDAYDDIATRCRCIIKSASVSQVANQPYYDFKTLGITDYLGTIGIFNPQTQFWLRDDVSLRDFDRIRRDWEMWVGTPQLWAPHSLQYVAITPNLSATAGETFTNWYWATAPILTLDSNTFLIAIDKQTMLENYATADLLGNAKEYSKAQDYWKEYEDDVPGYKERCVNLAKADLLLRI